MSRYSIERELLEELRRTLNNPTMAARDFLKWSTVAHKTSDQNLTIVRVERLGINCLVAKTADKRADKREPKPWPAGTGQTIESTGFDQAAPSNLHSQVHQTGDREPSDG